jgi:hypothetical protein
MPRIVAIASLVAISTARASESSADPSATKITSTAQPVDREARGGDLIGGKTHRGPGHGERGVEGGRGEVGQGGGHAVEPVERMLLAEIPRRQLRHVTAVANPQRIPRPFGVRRIGIDDGSREIEPIGLGGQGSFDRFGEGSKLRRVPQEELGEAARRAEHTQERIRHGGIAEQRHRFLRCLPQERREHPQGLVGVGDVGEEGKNRLHRHRRSGEGGDLGQERHGGVEAREAEPSQVGEGGLLARHCRRFPIRLDRGYSISRLLFSS